MDSLLPACIIRRMIGAGGTLRKFDLIVMVACISLLGYLGWHALKGPRGFDRMAELTVEQADLKNELGQITAEREAFDQRVALMRPDAVDPDMLDELARMSLEFARPADLIVRNPQSKSMQ